jgi:tetratricopeptide (TPR) repeat protein
MQVFLLLADAKGQVVTRNRLYDECWGGVNVGDYSLNRTITMVRRIAAATAPAAFRIESIPRTGYRLLVDGEAGSAAVSGYRKWRWPALLGGTIIAAALAASVWFVLNRGFHEPSIAVLASSKGASIELVGGIKSAAITNAAMSQTKLRILEGHEDADFIMNVREMRAGDDRRVDLDLVSSADKSLLWSWSGKKPEANATIIEQEAKLIGGSVLTCAAETRDGNGRKPDEETVKLYLDACSKFEPWSSADLRLLTDAFERVTQNAPQIRGAWAKLLISKGEAIEGLPPVDLVDSLKQDIRNAEARDIDIPELYGAKASALPANARFERLQILEAGLARYPTSASLLAGRSWLLRSLGRMDEAARTAQKLAMLYPQLSAANTEYANSLMHSGRIDAARHVLERAAKVTPDAANLEGSRWVLEMRYGDPKIALAIARNGNSVVEEPMLSFLEARIDPTKANVDRAIEQLRAGYRRYPEEPGWVAQALGAFGRTEEAIRFLLAIPGGDNSGGGAEMLFRPTLHEVRRDPRFMLIARNFGVTDYWIRSGIQPDFCFEPGLPYDCKRELAKVAK